MTHDELLALGLTEEQAGAVRAAFEALEEKTAAAEQAAAENAGLQQQIAALQAQIELRDKRDAALAALPAFKPRDVHLLIRLIDLAKIEMSEGKLSGLDEQIQALRAAAPYLFCDLPDPVGGNPCGGLDHTEFDMNAFLRGDR